MILIQNWLRSRLQVHVGQALLDAEAPGETSMDGVQQLQVLSRQWFVGQRVGFFRVHEEVVEHTELREPVAAPAVIIDWQQALRHTTS